MMEELIRFVKTTYATLTHSSPGGKKRCLPIIVPEGEHQANLYGQAVELLMEREGFPSLDLRDGDCHRAMRSFSLGWPKLSGKRPTDEFSKAVLPKEKRLLFCIRPVNPIFGWSSPLAIR